MYISLGEGYTAPLIWGTDGSRCHTLSGMAGPRLT